MHKQYNMVYILCIKQAIAWLSALVAGQYGSKTFSEPGPCTVCTEHTHSWQRLVHVWTWSLFLLVLALSKSAIVEIFSNTLCNTQVLFLRCVQCISIFWAIFNTPGWQKLREDPNGLHRKVWTQTKNLSPNIIPDICHEPHEHVRVNFFWLVYFFTDLTQKIGIFDRFYAKSGVFYRFNAKNWRFSV